MTTEREPGPVWASFEAWAGSGARKARGFTQDQRDRARAAWHARDPQLDALMAERDALMVEEALQRGQFQGFREVAWAERDALKAENQALRDAYAVLEAGAQAVWDAKSQSGDAIAAWTRLIDVLECSAEQINQDA